jgi:MoxR-like ATPase
MTTTNRISAFQGELAKLGYIAERNLSASLLLFSDMKRPLLLEGDAGVGKTEIARSGYKLRSL